MVEGELMSEKFSAAIEELQTQLEQQQQDVADTKKMINALRKRKPLATAAQEYLERRKQACPAEDIMRGLEQGGFDFDVLGWKDEKHRLRNVAISLAKNTQKFHKLPNNTFGLIAWYDPAVIKRAKEERGKQAESTEDEEAVEQASA